MTPSASGWQITDHMTAQGEKKRSNGEDEVS